MSFPAAVQSAVFYVLACTPCTNVRQRKRTKAKTKRDREKALLAGEDPNRYVHPEPFNTNPYWADEMAMGPHLPRKSKGSRTATGVFGVGSECHAEHIRQ